MVPPAARGLAFCLTLGAATTAYAQDSGAVVHRGALVRAWLGRGESATIVGRLHSPDSIVLRLAVPNVDNAGRDRADRLGATVIGPGTGDTVLVAMPWRTVFSVEVASGTRSIRVANGFYGALVGGAVGGAAGAVIGAATAKSNCASGSSTLCGISQSTGEGAAIGTTLGAIAGAIWGASRHAEAVVWTALPDRGLQLRSGAPPPTVTPQP